MRFFNTTGPVEPERHYFVPHRLNEKLVNQLIQEQKYFILHAPRQSGKTTCIVHFVRKLNAEGIFKALYINVEPAQVARDNVEKGMGIILNALRSWATSFLPKNDSLFNHVDEQLKQVSGHSLANVLQSWSNSSDKPVILFIDEIDSLVGDTLISVLRQLRAGYLMRPHGFPQTVCLVGVRDVKDYQIWSSEENKMIMGGSAFNIKAKSLELSSFSLEQVRDLYHQHTHETGQQFADEAIDYAFEQTQGQPWLVNALAYEACFEMVTDRTQPITKEIIEKAKETLIARRDTHLDVLIDRLQEPRVRRIMDDVISGKGAPEDFPVDDIKYVKDLGLIVELRNKVLTIANPIYQEVIPRELVQTTQYTIYEETQWYQRSDGSMDVKRMLEAFAQFYRENSAIWLEKFAYKEAGPHLLLMAFLQRVINGGGKIHREYALGRKRVDLTIDWPYGNKQVQRIVIEVKIHRSSKTLTDGLDQTAHYMDVVNATEGHLVIFDPNTQKTWDEKMYHKQEVCAGKTIDVWGM